MAKKENGSPVTPSPEGLELIKDLKRVEYKQMLTKLNKLKWHCKEEQDKILPE